MGIVGHITAQLRIGHRSDFRSAGCRRIPSVKHISLGRCRIITLDIKGLALCNQLRSDIDRVVVGVLIRRVIFVKGDPVTRLDIRHKLNVRSRIYGNCLSVRIVHTAILPAPELLIVLRRNVGDVRRVRIGCGPMLNSNILIFHDSTIFVLVDDMIDIHDLRVDVDRRTFLKGAA